MSQRPDLPPLPSSTRERWPAGSRFCRRLASGHQGAVGVGLARMVADVLRVTRYTRSGAFEPA
eukprot:7915197-Alexandrium_andersonii.AAC.1